ncbi:hypothetical protein GGS20DRAFT_592383 [Poronia punctata]|nr:hypothetical protein GGS20DRAFT_592383 [Poronia punctata]
MHHPHQSPAATSSHQLQHTRPSSIAHPQHHQASSAQSQHPSTYSSHSIQPYHPGSSHSSSAQHNQDIPYYAHQNQYSTAGTSSAYTAPDNTEMMAAAQMSRPYPPMSYHTPQSNSPAPVASPSTHEHRNIYGQPQSQLQHQSIYYGTQQPQYSSMPPQAPSPYQQHAPQPHQSMTSQPSMMMSQAGPSHQMPQHASQHAQPGINGSPRHAPKLEPQMTPQLQRPPPGPLGAPQGNQNAGQLSTPTGPAAPGINNNAAPGPIPATTPLVVRQDNNGVQWIAFEYSRDRVKMEYTIRCDVESVNTDDLGQEFRTENCVYPRACCAKDQYRGNRLQYETECNTVGWALAQLNPCLRGKRGLIQRAVDSWRNSNQDPRLRSRRVRRMAKMNTRKAAANPHGTHLPGPGAPGGMPAPGPMGPSAGPSRANPGMSNMSSQMHHHHAHEGNASGGGDEVGDEESMEGLHHHHHPPATGLGPGQGPGQGPGSVSREGSADGSQPAHVLTPDPLQNPSPSPMYPGLSFSGRGRRPLGRRQLRPDEVDPTPEGLFPPVPDSRKRKFLLVDDDRRGSRLRVRVQLEIVNTKEIPDSFRKWSAVYPRSYFPREMQDPPPNAAGSNYFEDDMADDGGDVANVANVANGANGAYGANGVNGAGPGSAQSSVHSSVHLSVQSVEHGSANGFVHSRPNLDKTTEMITCPVGRGPRGQASIPRTRKSTRTKEVRLNDLAYRLGWLNGRPFAGRKIFLQRALDSYRNKTANALESTNIDVMATAPHFQTRPGKKKWDARINV